GRPHPSRESQPIENPRLQREIPSEATSRMMDHGTSELTNGRRWSLRRWSPVACWMRFLRKMRWEVTKKRGHHLGKSRGSPIIDELGTLIP
ncbi:UNVERIFIED_CONTAM: hypothetical protein Sradi_3428800, partial [Sesamum radiatum]